MAFPRIFMIGNGPSLDPKDLDLIKGEYSFGINRIGMIFDRTDWRPSYYLCASLITTLDKDYLKDVFRVIDLGIPCFIGERIRHVIGERDNITYIKCLHIHDDPEGDWWEDISNLEVSIFGQSLFGAVRIATWLGFNHIYLLGVDGGYKNSGDEDENHFDPGYETKELRKKIGRISAKQFNRIHASHEMLYRNAKKYGFDIYSVSRRTAFDVYPKKKLEDVL